MDFTIEIVEQHHYGALQAVRELWSEYWTFAGLAREFQDFQQELLTLPGVYSPPGGRLLLARVAGSPAGTAAFRPLENGACEAKRLFVRSEFRRKGIAAALLEKIVAGARSCGYRTLYGDTLPSMATTLDMYRRIGFEEVGPYSRQPTPGAIYLRLNL